MSIQASIGVDANETRGAHIEREGVPRSPSNTKDLRQASYAVTIYHCLYPSCFPSTILSYSVLSGSRFVYLSAYSTSDKICDAGSDKPFRMSDFSCIHQRKSLDIEISGSRWVPMSRSFLCITSDTPCAGG